MIQMTTVCTEMESSQLQFSQLMCLREAVTLVIFAE